MASTPPGGQRTGSCRTQWVTLGRPTQGSHPAAAGRGVHGGGTSILLRVASTTADYAGVTRVVIIWWPTQLQSAVDHWHPGLAHSGTPAPPHPSGHCGPGARSDTFRASASRWHDATPSPAGGGTDSARSMSLGDLTGCDEGPGAVPLQQVSVSPSRTHRTPRAAANPKRQPAQHCPCQCGQRARSDSSRRGN